MEEMQKKLAECVMHEDFDPVNEDVQRAMVSVTVFRTQMKIFEKMFLAEKHYESTLINTRGSMKIAEKTFDPQMKELKEKSA